MKSYTNNPALLDKRSIGMASSKPVNPPVPEVRSDSENWTLLRMAERYFGDMKTMIEERKRVIEYRRGNQWSDTITDPDTGETITEETYLKRQGAVPLKQNLLAKFMKNLSGQYQKSPVKSTVLSNKDKTSKVGEMLTNTLYYAHQINDGQYLTARMFDEFMLSGLAVAKVLFPWRPELSRSDLLFTKPDVRRIIFNTDISDPRFYDLNFVCEIMDVPIEKIISTFARDEEDEKVIRSLYPNAATNDYYNLEGLDQSATDALDFYVPYEPGKCRLYEIWYEENVWGLEVYDPLDVDNPWRFEEKGDLELYDLENKNRILTALANGIPEEDVALIEVTKRNSTVCKFKFLTPNGYCLSEGTSPYEHGSHPFVILGFPLIDGMIWGPMLELLDQQRNINRYITQLNFISSASSKGTWVIPEESKPDDMTKADYIKELTRIGGAVWYKADRQANPEGREPKQLFSNAVPVGIIEALNIQMSLMNEISGQQPAMQGARPAAGTPAALYAQEIDQAGLNTSDFILAFAYFIKMLDTKIVKTIIQFYNEPRKLHIAGENYTIESREYNPELVDSFDFDLIVTPGSNSPTYNMAMNDTLWNLLENRFIDIVQFLKSSSLPFKDKLLELIDQQQKALQSGQPVPGVPPELMNQIQGMSDPRAMQLINS